MRVLRNKQKRRARLMNCEGSFTVEEFVDLCLLYDGKCLSCGRDDERLTVDHVIPLVNGDTNSIDNIQPLCKSCNSKKGTNSTDYRIGFALGR